MEKRITVGIGCTSYNRPECLAKWKEQIAKHTSMDNVFIYIAVDTDEDRQGVAKRKNECLRALKDCDHIFLYDDDCWPIADGWVDYLQGGHWLFLNDKMHKYLGGNTYQECGGVFMSLTKQMVEAVGAFNENFYMWGFEHAEYSMRIYKSGFMLQPYMCKYGTDKFLYAADYSDPSHQSSITDLDKQRYFNENLPKFRESIKNIYLPL